MTIIEKSSYSLMDRQILYDEYVNHKNEVALYSRESPYYVYVLTYPTGHPFYVGKGKGNRAFDHIKNYINNKITNKWLREVFVSLGDEPPIMHIVKGNLTADESLSLEKNMISEYGRKITGGSLCNIMSGGNFDITELCKLSGTLGGIKTKTNKLGIFSDDYDRGAQTKNNWAAGLMDHLNFFNIGTLGGNKVVIDKVGIHNPIYQNKRSEWGRIGAQASIEAGLSGICSDEWRKENLEKTKTICSNGGKVGGKIVGSMFWWNNGIINKKSLECPEGFVRGQLMSEKKRLTVRKNFKTKENNE